MIDYRGWRLICTSALPLGKDTLRYGSDDAGQTVRCDDPLLNQMMEQAAYKINIKKHSAGFQMVKGTDSVYGVWYVYTLCVCAQ